MFHICYLEKRFGLILLSGAVEQLGIRAADL